MIRFVRWDAKTYSHFLFAEYIGKNDNDINDTLANGSAFPWTAWSCCERHRDSETSSRDLGIPTRYQVQEAWP